MWIDEVMMHSPLATSTSTRCEMVIIEYDCPEYLIRREWTLESYCPTSSSIYIPTKIDKESRIFAQYILYLVYEISLAYSTELEEYISVEHYCISDDLDISIVSVSFF